MNNRDDRDGFGSGAEDEYEGNDDEFEYIFDDEQDSDFPHDYDSGGGTTSTETPAEHFTDNEDSGGGTHMSISPHRPLSLFTALKQRGKYELYRWRKTAQVALFTAKHPTMVSLSPEDDYDGFEEDVLSQFMRHGTISDEDLLSLAMHAGAARIYFTNPTITARQQPTANMEVEDRIKNGPTLTGSVVAEMYDTHGNLVNMHTGNMTVPLGSLYTELMWYFRNPGLSFRELVEEISEGNIATDVIAIPDMLLAGEKLDKVDLFFGRGGRIDKLAAKVDGLHLEAQFAASPDPYRE